eukprot:6120175-Prorocentrum_lima.AAC.1
MKARNISIMGLQETRSRATTKEVRQQTTWYFAGSPETAHPPAAVYATGVALVISNSLMKSLADVEPISDRLIRATFRASTPLT